MHTPQKVILGSGNKRPGAKALALRMIFRRAKALRLIPKGKKQRLVEVGAA